MLEVVSCPTVVVVVEDVVVVVGSSVVEVGRRVVVVGLAVEALGAHLEEYADPDPAHHIAALDPVLNLGDSRGRHAPPSGSAR